MTKYREIIRLSGLGLSQTNIALSKRNRAAGTRSSAMEKCHCWHLYLPPHMNWRKALSFTAIPSHKSIKKILDTGSDQAELPDRGVATDRHTDSGNVATRLQEALITTGASCIIQV